jgi:hypothetical protein
MKSAADIKNIDIKSWRKLANAFYSLAHNDFDAWITLPKNLKQTDVGLICEQYLRTENEYLIEKAGCLLAGKHWYVALGR